MPTRTTAALLAVAALVLVGGWAWDAGLFLPARPPLVETPEAIAAGFEVYLYRCAACHRDVPLPQRVAGWTAEQAYQTIGRLQEHPRASMPTFQGSESDRRVLAIWLSALGAGRARQR